MTIRDDINQLKTGDRQLRKFGLLVGGVFALLGLFFLFRDKAHWPYFLLPGAALIASGALLPRALKYVYVAWMSAAFVLGFVMAHVLLTLFFFLVIAPIGLAARCFVPVKAVLFELPQDRVFRPRDDARRVQIVDPQQPAAIQ